MAKLSLLRQILVFESLIHHPRPWGLRQCVSWLVCNASGRANGFGLEPLSRKLPSSPRFLPNVFKKFGTRQQFTCPFPGVFLVFSAHTSVLRDSAQLCLSLYTVLINTLYLWSPGPGRRFSDLVHQFTSHHIRFLVNYSSIAKFDRPSYSSGIAHQDCHVAIIMISGEPQRNRQVSDRR